MTTGNQQTSAVPRAVRRLLFVLLAVLGSSCNSAYTLSGSAESKPTYGPAGVTFAIDITSNAPGGVAINFSALPSSISVSPTTASTDSNGKATAYALVPYGVDGTVVATASFSTTASIPLFTDPVSIPCMYWNETSSGVYRLRAQVADGQQLISGVPVDLAVIDPVGVVFATVTPTAPVTDDAGVATAFVAVSLAAFDAGVLPIVVEGVAGSGALTVSIGTAQTGDAGSCQ